MKVGIIGSGGREHALCYFIKKSAKVDKIYCFPGNAGTSKIDENIQADLNNFEELKNIIIEKEIDYLIVGPEKPLVDGIVDFFEKHKIKTFGPNKVAAELEGSKIFTKKICQKYKIPTADFGVFNKSTDAFKFIESSNFPLVVKADGLAAGKGVYICEDKNMAHQAILEVFGGKFGLAEEILIEEFLDGEEMSYFIISDGKTYKKFQTAQDHKRVFEGDKGKNTGGMGAYSPSRLINQTLEKKIISKIIKPTLRGLKDLQIVYKGFLYAGLMIKDNEPYLIEYNVRMGDPECQTILPKLKTDLLDIFLSCCDGKLDQLNIDWDEKKSMCVVLCSNGYPDKYEKNVLIENISKIKTTKDDFCFHAGTNINENKIFAIGGRVLNFVSLSDNFSEARKKIISKIKELDWTQGFYRKDIGHKVIDQ